MGNVIDRASKKSDELQNQHEQRDSFHDHFPERFICGSTMLCSTMINVLKSPPNSIPALRDEALRDRALDRYPDLDIGKVNVAFMGGVESGKMSLINAFVEKPRNATAEKTGQYLQAAHPRLDHIVLWYIPDDHDEDWIPREDYFFEKCLYAFDLVVFVEGNRIRPGDIELAKQAYHKKPFTPIAFIRSKIDGLLIAQIGRVGSRREWELEKDMVSNRIRALLYKQLEPANLTSVFDIGDTQTKIDRDHIVNRIRKRLRRDLGDDEDPDLIEKYVEHTMRVPVWLISVAGILDANGVEDNDFKYVVDDLQPYWYLGMVIEEFRANKEENEGY